VSSLLKERLQDDMKTAMKAQDKARLAVIRFILAAIKQKEIDDRVSLTDEQVIAIIEKLVKQRHDGILHWEKAGRHELVEKENFELSILRSYMPEPLSSEAIDILIKEAIQETGATSMRDMGKVMALIKPKVQGRTDISMVSQQIKALLS